MTLKQKKLLYWKLNWLCLPWFLLRKRGFQVKKNRDCIAGWVCRRLEKTKTVAIFESDVDMGGNCHWRSGGLCFSNWGGLYVPWYMSVDKGKKRKFNAHHLRPRQFWPFSLGDHLGALPKSPLPSRPRAITSTHSTFHQSFTNFMKIFSLKSPFWLLEVGTSGRSQVHAIPLGGAECPKIFGTSFPPHSGYISENYQTLND